METIELKDGDCALVLREAGLVEMFLAVPEDEDSIANRGVMVIATLSAIFQENPENEPAFHAMINNRMKHYFGEAPNQTGEDDE